MRTQPKETILLLFKVLLLFSIIVQSGCAKMDHGADTAATFSYDQSTLAKEKPWTEKDFQNNPENF